MDLELPIWHQENDSQPTKMTGNIIVLQWYTIGIIIMIYDNDKSYPFRGLRHDDRDVYKHAQKLYMGLSEEREPPNSLVNHHPSSHSMIFNGHIMPCMYPNVSIHWHISLAYYTGLYWGLNHAKASILQKPMCPSERNIWGSGSRSCCGAQGEPAKADDYFWEDMARGDALRIGWMKHLQASP